MGDYAAEAEHGGRGSVAAADPIAFATEFPTDGRYRLFLQFHVDGEVQTAAFTREALR